MKNKLLVVLTIICLHPLAGAAVSLTFNSTTNGFIARPDATSVAWNSYHGGSLAVTVPTGWKPQSAYLDIQANAALLAELNSALVNGGTVSYTIYLEQADISGSNPPWFETMYIGNSSAGWDQQFGQTQGQATILLDAYPLPSTFSFNVSYPILNAPAVGDTNAQFALGSPWNQINIGVNSGGAVGYTGAKFYVDNFTISANAVPEPAAVSLGLLGLFGLAVRRRR